MQELLATPTAGLELQAYFFTELTTTGAGHLTMTPAGSSYSALVHSTQLKTFIGNTEVGGTGTVLSG